MSYPPFLLAASSRMGIQACSACLGIKEDLQLRLNRKLAPRQICCFAGLTELAVPVLAGGNHVATLIGGQVFREKPNRRRFERLTHQLRHWGMGKELPRLEKAFFQTPVLSKRQLHGALRILVVIAAQLGDFASR